MSRIHQDKNRDRDAAETGLGRPTSRRGFVRMLGVGGATAVASGALLSCDSDIINVPVQPGGPGAGPAPGGGVAPVTGVSFDLRTDVGFLRLIQVLEEVEAFFYTAVVASSNFNSFFNVDEREVLVDLRDAEVLHLEVVRAALGSQAVPSLVGSFNMTTVNTLLSSRLNILNTARGFESLGVSGLNGSGKYLTDGRNLLFAGKVASVEGRHLAALRELLPPSGVNANTAFASDDTIDAMGRDIKLEAGDVIARALAANVLLPGTLAAQPISNMPTAAQAVPTANFFPATP